MTVWHQAICAKCEPSSGQDRPRYLSPQPRTEPGTARIDRDVHNKQNHGDSNPAEVREFEAEAMGDNAHPKEIPEP